MKTLLRTIILWALTTIAPLTCYADFEDDSYGTEKQITPQELSPFKFNATADFLGKAKIIKKKFKDNHLQYGQSDFSLDTTFYYDPNRIEGALVSLGWSFAKFHWEDNPFFERQYFHIGTLALSAFSARCYSWFWQGRIAINISTDHFNFNEYANYDLLLWGRYHLDCWPQASFHIGLLAQTGMKIDHVYPILGFDWQMTPCWKLNLVFPINMSALYTYNKEWTVGISGRFVSTRYRADKSKQRFRGARFSKATIEYSALGIEGLVTYNRDSWINGNFHAGYMVGARMKIANRHNRHGHWFDLGGTPYVGGELTVKF